MATRDMNVIRGILLRIEEHDYNAKAFEIEIEGCSKTDVQYHCALLQEAGLIRAQDIGNRPSGERWIPIRLTWEGHEFLDAARDVDRWERVTEKAMGLSFGKSSLIRVGWEGLLD
jgi:hypothetical protein